MRKISLVEFSFRHSRLIVILSIIVYKGLRAVGNSELYMQGVIIVIILTISIYALFFAKPENMKGFDLAKVFKGSTVLMTAIILTLVIVMLFPQVVLWLPSTMQ